MPEDRGRRVFRFGAFEASEASGELRKHGVRIKIHGQPFQVLILLLERPSEVVTREEMRQFLWGDDTFVDFDHGLNSAVNKIREALDDSASQPRYIETIAGKGYRFIERVFRPEEMRGVPASESLTQKSATSVAVPSEPIRDPQEGDKRNPSILTVRDELPMVSHRLVRTMLLLMQAMYLGFYAGALANLAEIHDIFVETNLAPGVFIGVLTATALALIPVRLYLFAAVALDFPQLWEKFSKMFWLLLGMDLLWALSPLLLVHHISAGLALGLCTPLVYAPFAQRSLLLMYTNRRSH